MRNALHQYNFHTYLGSARTPALFTQRAPNKGTFLVAVRQAGFYCYSAKLDAPSGYGLLVWLHLVIGSLFGSISLLAPGLAQWLLSWKFSVSSVTCTERLHSWYCAKSEQPKITSADMRK